MTSSGSGRHYGVETLSIKEKGLVDMLNSVVIAMGRGIRGLTGNGKNKIKIK